MHRNIRRKDQFAKTGDPYQKLGGGVCKIPRDLATNRIYFVVGILLPIRRSVRPATIFIQLAGCA